MDKNDKEELFDSTEIDIEQIKKPESADEWDVVSEFEVDTYPTPYISVPKMREFDEKIEGYAYGTSIESDIHDTREISSCHNPDQINKRTRTKIDKAVQAQSIQHEQKQLNEKEVREIEEAMQQQQLSQHQQEQDNERVLREIEEAMQQQLTQHQQQQDNEMVLIEIEEAMQQQLTQHQQQQDNERVLTEIEEAMQQLHLSQREQKLENERVVRGIDEAMQEKPHGDLLKQENEMVVREMQENIKGRCSPHEKEHEMKQKYAIKLPTGEGLTTKQFKLPVKCPEASKSITVKEQLDDKISQEVSEAIQVNTVTSSAARFSNSPVHAAECESFAKTKYSESKAIQSALSKALEDFCEFAADEKAKASTKAAKVDKLKKERGSQIKLCSEYLVSFRNEESDSQSSNEEENEEVQEKSKKEKN